MDSRITLVDRRHRLTRAPRERGARLSTSGARILQQSGALAVLTRISEDNLAMNKGSSLPWTVGGLMVATLGGVIVIGSSSSGVAPDNLPTQALSQTTAQALPAIDPVAAPASAPTAPIAQNQAVSAQTAPANQFWECTINGQETFSDSPCGGNSSLREISPINRMDPAPILRQARSYEPEASYPPEYPEPSDQDDYDPRPQEFAVNSYPVFVAIPFHERRRPDQTHRPRGHRPSSNTGGTWPQPPAYRPKTR